MAGNSNDVNTTVVLDQDISQPVIYPVDPLVNHNINISGACDFGTDIILFINYNPEETTRIEEEPPSEIINIY